MSNVLSIHNLRSSKGSDALGSLQRLRKDERQRLTEILHHLREVERRKLFSDLKYRGLFEYAVQELKYSEGEAGRRIQAMRLLQELPELEEKLKSGSLSLSNICQAQSYFKDVKKVLPANTVTPSVKLRVLKALENKSARSGEKVLLEIRKEDGMAAPLPKERERPLTEELSEMRFIMDEDLKRLMEEFKGLLGPKVYKMNFSDLVKESLLLGNKALKEKRFGKRRVASSKSECPPELKHSTASSLSSASSSLNDLGGLTPTSEFKGLDLNKVRANEPNASGDEAFHKKRTSRYISKAVKFQIWERDQGKCTQCQSGVNAQFDHIQPFALGGESSEPNLRLLCHHCNQRAGIKMGLIHS